MDVAQPGEILGQRAAQRLEPVVRPVDAQLHVLDAHFERVAALRAAHGHRAGEDVRAEERLHRVDDLAMLGQQIGALADVAG